MTEQPLTPAQRREHSGEQAVAVALLAIAASEGYAVVARRRWRRGKTMVGPARIYLLAWIARSVIWFVHVLSSGNESGASALGFVGIAVILSGVVGAATWLVWIVAVAAWEALVWAGHTDSQLTANVVGRWLTVDECRANKAQLEVGLSSAVPTLVMSGLLVAAGNGGILLGSDLAVIYTSHAKPWLDWNQAEAQLSAGQPVWSESSPPVGQTMAIVGPFIRGGIWATAVALWVGCLVDLSAGDSVTITVLAGLATVIVLRHRIRAVLTARNREV